MSFRNRPRPRLRIPNYPVGMGFGLSTAVLSESLTRPMRCDGNPVLWGIVGFLEDNNHIPRGVSGGKHEILGTGVVFDAE